MNSVSFPFNIMAFPAGPECNLDCDYCYYLDKTDLYPETTSFKMDLDLLENFIKQYTEAHPGPVIQFGWQGGEPTLRGLDFFKRALELETKYVPGDMNFENSFQTNGLLLDEEWAEFLGRNDFLVGLSLDGPAGLHNAYRTDKKGRGSHRRVMKGLKLLQEYDVKYNILCTVHDANAQYPGRVYDFFREQGVKHIQFIPIVEPRETGVSSRTVNPGDWGRFLISVFNRWITQDYGKIFIQTFEECVSAWIGQGPSLCVFSETCGKAPVLEHNGDVFACDHFVFPEYRLGNIRETHLAELVSSDEQKDFGDSKLRDLPPVCRRCEYNFICHGGCPKNRISQTEEGKQGLNYLCSGYRQFFNYIDPYLQEISTRLQQRQSPNLIKKKLQQLYEEIWSNIGRNDPCPCGSGKKYKKCCLNQN